MIALLLPYAARLVGPKLAKPMVYGGLAVMAVLLLWLVISRTVASIRADAVNDFVTAQNAKKAEAARKADHAADTKEAERVAEQATEQALLNEGIRNEATNEMAGPGVTGVLERIRVRGKKP